VQLRWLEYDDGAAMTIAVSILIIAEMAGLLVLLVAQEAYLATGRGTGATYDRFDSLTYAYFMFVFATLGAAVLIGAFS
jgi:hypothetical protein